MLPLFFLAVAQCAMLVTAAPVPQTSAGTLSFASNDAAQQTNRCIIAPCAVGEFDVPGRPNTACGDAAF